MHFCCYLLVYIHNKKPMGVNNNMKNNKQTVGFGEVPSAFPIKFSDPYSRPTYMYGKGTGTSIVFNMIRESLGEDYVQWLKGSKEREHRVIIDNVFTSDQLINYIRWGNEEDTLPVQEDVFVRIFGKEKISIDKHSLLAFNEYQLLHGGSTAFKLKAKHLNLEDWVLSDIYDTFNSCPVADDIVKHRVTKEDISLKYVNLPTEYYLNIKGIPTAKDLKHVLEELRYRKREVTAKYFDTQTILDFYDKGKGRKKLTKYLIEQGYTLDMDLYQKKYAKLYKETIKNLI